MTVTSRTNRAPHCSDALGVLGGPARPPPRSSAVSPLRTMESMIWLQWVFLKSSCSLFVDERKSVLAAFSASFSGLSVCLRGPALPLARCLSCSTLIAESCTSSAARAAAVCLSTARAGNRGFGR